VATPCCNATELRVHPLQVKKPNDGMFGTITMLFVRCARSWARAEYQDLDPRNPCCSSITPWAWTVPSACVGKYQSAAPV
jgi:hypothetical protein